jgi:hypothetical protein
MGLEVSWWRYCLYFNPIPLLFVLILSSFYLGVEMVEVSKIYSHFLAGPEGSGRKAFRIQAR